MILVFFEFKRINRLQCSLFQQHFRTFTFSIVVIHNLRNLKDNF